MDTSNADGELILCFSTYEKGQPLIRELNRLGCRVVLLTVDNLRGADWPHDALHEFHTMPANLTPAQVTNTVTYLARIRKFARIIALDEFDMEIAASLREHLRIPGMGLTTTRNFRDKLAMRTKAAHLHVRVPEFCAVLNYDDLTAYMRDVPAPWLLKPRSEASAVGIRKLDSPDQLWHALEELGDRQSWFLLERFIAGDIFHADSIVNDSKVVFTAVHQYGKPPMEVMHQGGVFTTRAIPRGSNEDQAIKEINAPLIPALGLVRGVTHTEFIRSRENGEFYFLETAARVGGAFVADVVEYTYSINPWIEWARLEVAAMRREPYVLPPILDDYAGSVICLARVPEPDTAAYNADEVVYRMKKHHHAGLIVRSHSPSRVADLLEEYSRRFFEEFCAIEPVPDKPTS